MIEGSINVSLHKKYEKLFSICCIATNPDEYILMKESFVGNGFTNDCEYLVANNVGSNHFDAYYAIKRFLQEAKGAYIILVHQDVRCIDSISVLSGQLSYLDQKDPQWAICGNAGAYGYKNTFYHLDNNGRVRKTGGLPARVTSLDENLLVLKNDATLSISADIGDFHFYGTDICQVAEFLGYHCYVIGFMVKHLSTGNLDKLMQQEPVFIEKYGRKLRHRFVQTTCTKFYLSNSVLKNKFYNSSFVFFWVKAYNRLLNNFRKPY
jgi:hypothetical protein